MNFRLVDILTEANIGNARKRMRDFIYRQRWKTSDALKKHPLRWERYNTIQIY